MGSVTCTVECFETICKLVSAEYPYDGIKEALQARIKDTFYHPQKQVFTMNAGQEQYTELGNALAILAEAVTGEEAEALCQKLVSRLECRSRVYLSQAGNRKEHFLIVSTVDCDG